VAQMGQSYVLINKSKNEIITFAHLLASKERELCGNPVTSAITTWYLLKNLGDKIQFIAEQSDEELNLTDYFDVTDKVIDDLIANEILLDQGIEVFDEEESEVFVRRLENIWMKN
jgi:hypothetical protein